MVLTVASDAPSDGAPTGLVVNEISPPTTSNRSRLHSIRNRRSTKPNDGSEEDAKVIAEMQAKIERTKAELSELRNQAKDCSFQDAITASARSENINLQLNPETFKFKVRRTLRGHLSKVLRIKWIEKTNDLLSISPDGRVLYWDTISGMKKMLRQLPSLWSTCCDCSSDGRLLASGGLDNVCTIRSLKNLQQALTLSGHQAFISQCMFLSNDERVLTSSGDKTLILWDVSTTQPIHVFKGHSGDVLDMCLSDDQKYLLSVSVDRTCRVWDVTHRLCNRICEGHEGDVNCARFFPNGQAFVTGSDDQSCKLFDMRSDQYLASYSRPKSDKPAGVTSVALSKSGRAIIAGCEDSKCLVWDTLHPGNLLTTLSHPNRVSAVCVNFNGDAIATGSWDCNIRIWN